MGEKAVPFGQGEVNVDGGEYGDEVVFERANVPFGDIRTVVLGGNMLDEGAVKKSLDRRAEETAIILKTIEQRNFITAKEKGFDN